MRYSGIGGQAVMEGVMMKNKDRYAVAVRKPNHEIEVKVEAYAGIGSSSFWIKVPFVRGILSFIDSLVLGMSTLMYSASFFEDEETEGKQETGSQEDRKDSSDVSSKKEKKAEAREKAFVGGTVTISMIIAIAIFMVLPYYLSQLFGNVIHNMESITVIEGFLRLAIFIGYIAIISQMKDIQRVFMYHGAEHKCINCIEHGLDLSLENVRKSSKEHKRCGTSFLMFVVIISIILFLFIRVDSHVMRIVIRLLLVPVIAGISFELLRLAGKKDNALINLISKPGLLLQRLTTREPDDDMIEVGIVSVEAVFDWKTYVKEVRQEELK